jgi:carboxymethylenebutenolidase
LKQIFHGEQMRIRIPSFILLTVCLNVLPALSQEPTRITRDPEVKPAVWGVLETPSAPGPHPAVIILGGSAGWRPFYAEIARNFADSGFVTLAVDYYAETGRDTTRVDRLMKWPLWKATVRNAVEYLKASTFVSGQPIGLVGYSRGAFIAVAVASSLPEVKAVVDFFGGGGAAGDSLEETARGFPPLLILHGEADNIVPVRFAYRLREVVIAEGGEVEMHIYTATGHAFNAPWAPTYREAEAVDSWKRTIRFLRKHLGK